MSTETNPTNVGGTEPSTQEKTFTQEELNTIINDRLSREKAKYADYEDIKAKAAKFDEQEEANKSELQKALDKAASLQTQLDTLNKANDVRAVRDKVSATTGVPATLQ